MKRGPGMRRIEKGDEEGYVGVAMNVCLGIQKIQHIFNMTPARNQSNREGRRPILPQIFLIGFVKYQLTLPDRG